MIARIYPKCAAENPMTRKLLNPLTYNHPPFSGQACAAFSTTTIARSVKVISRGVDGSKKRGAKTFTMKNKKTPKNKGRPPAPGERRAMRRRIVLSNVNALEVPGMQELSAASMMNTQLRGEVISIPGPVVDQLRASEAFKVSQAWGMFKRPAMLVRKETLQLGRLFDQMNKKEKPQTIRKILVGERGSGKSLLLLQAMSMAFVQNWIVINIPEAMYLTMGDTEYAPIKGTTPTLYSQNRYTATLLSNIARANTPLLSTLTLSQTHTLPIPIQSNISLDRLALLGASDPPIAWPIFCALWTELTLPGRPKLLLAIDGLGHAMKNSTYMSAIDYKPIHAHDLALLNWFMKHLSGTKSLPNGGIVITATSESNHPKVPTLRFKITQLEALQNPSPSAASTAPPPTLPFLRATGQEHNPIPQPDPFARYDEKVMRVLSNEGNNIEIQRLTGLSKEEARGLMEYWAKSGLMRRLIDERLVGEKWTISGGGVVGELERGCLRMRI